MKKSLIFFLIFLCLPGALMAQTTRTWVSSTGGVWTTAGNWNPAGAPATGDNVIINAPSGPITAVPNISLLSLTINGNCSLRSTRRTITITGTLTVADGATLSLGTVAGPFTRLSLAVNSNGFIRGNGKIDNNGSTQGYFNVRGTLTLDAAALVTGNQLFRLFSGGRLIIANPSGISRNGPTGAIQVTGTRTFSSGANYVYNGSEPQVTGNGLTAATPANLTIDNSAGVTLSTVTTISRLLTITSGWINMGSYNLTVGSLTGSGNITGTSGARTLTVGSDNTSPAPFTGIISDGSATLALNKRGSGALTLAGLNSYTGLTSIAGGILRLGVNGNGTNSPLGSIAGRTNVTGSASLDLNGFNLGTAEPLNLNTTGASGGGAIINSSANGGEYNGPVTLIRASNIIANAGNIIIGGTITGTFNLTLGGTGTGTISSIIGISTATVAKSGTGTWTVSGENTFTGTTNISAGTLKLGAPGNSTNSPLGAAGGARTTVTSGAVFDLNGITLSTAEALTINGTGISGGGALTNSSALDVVYTGLIRLGTNSSIVASSGFIDIANAGTIIGVASDLTLGGSGNGNITSIIGVNISSVIKTGFGTWTLSGANSFSGGLTISQGTIQLGAANRIATQTVTMNGGTFRTGASTGYTETVGSLVLTGNSNIMLGTGLHRLTFSDSSGETWTSDRSLIITFWEGNIGGPGTAGRIFCGTTSSGLTAAQLGQIKFLIGGIYYTASIRNNGEVVPGSLISITTGTITGSPFCAGSSVVVPFSITGSFVTGNTFTAQLSDAAGIFDTPENIGSSTTAGSITATIPLTAASGTQYRIRVISSSPALTGVDNGVDLEVIASLSSVAISPANLQYLCSTGTGIPVTATETGGGTGSHRWGKRIITGGEITEFPAETSVTYTPKSGDFGPGTWYLVSISTPACGSEIISNEVTIVVGASTWTGLTSTDWNTSTNWCDGIPTSSSNVFIPSSPNMPVISGTAFCNNIIIGPGAILTVDPTGQLTVNNAITNNGTLNLNSNTSGIFSMIMSSYSGSGTTNAQLFITGGGTPNYNWHYVTEPFLAGISKTFFLDVNAKNLLGYDESRVTTTDYQGWTKHDGIAVGQIAAGGAFTDISYGKGYNFYNGTDATINLTGTTPIGTTLGAISLQYSGSSDNLPIFGYNLLGNSLTCSLDWDLAVFSGSVGHTVYYTTGNKWASYMPGVGGTNGGGRYIPPLQGFFVQAFSTGSAVDLTGAKVHQTAQNRYKKSGSNSDDTNGEYVYPKVKLELSGSGTSDETIIWFNNDATSGFDASYDGYKFFPSDGSGQLYSITGGQNYVINGMSLQSDSIVVPLGMRIGQSGSYSIMKNSLEELENYNVLLVDRVNGNIKVDLKNTEKYTFSSDAGTVSDRFALIFVSRTKSAEMPHITNKKFNIYSTADFINIMPPDDYSGSPAGNVRVYSLTGTIVHQANDVAIERGSLIQIPFNGRQGIYIVEIVSGLSRFTGKIIVR